MRQGQNPKRTRGRSQGRRSNVPSRHQTFDSNGPSVRIRGNAAQVHEKYLAMARDAASAGDRIAAENYQQHAEHYYRIINVDNDGDGRGRGDAERANRLQQESQSDGDGETEAAVVVETVKPPPTGNDEEVGEGSEQPAVEFPVVVDATANGSDEAQDSAPKKPRAPRTPRTPRGRTRAPRASDGAADGNTRPSPPEE